MDRERVIAVVRVADMTDVEDMMRLTGARIEQCRDCGEDVMVAPSTDEALVNGWPLICLQCCGLTLQEAGRMIVEEHGLTPAQMEEAKLVDEYYRNRN